MYHKESQLASRCVAAWYIESVDKVKDQKRTVFMEKIDHNAHSVYLMYYHLIMAVKYRRKVSNDPISERAKEI